ncbi:MAG: DUF3368 domain-containing protein [Pseudomonadota bacterium]|nr:DUF3368 domain-containing protein [Pseudomonadota bacterium]
MRVVANASPLNYLVLIEAAHLLSELFGTVIIPQAVQEELRHASAPEAVRGWIDHKPDWLLVRTVQPENGYLARLHRGEREAILLAERVTADLIILDERAARRAATERGLRVTGTLGVLNFAAQRGLVDVSQVIERLRRTSFRASPAMYQWLLDQQRSRF